MISENVVKGILKILKPRKSCGMNNIRNEFLKNLPDSGVKHLTFILNACLKFQYFPTVRECLPTSGKPNNETESYRPISLLSGIGKLFEKIIIKEKLSIVMEDRNIIPQEQFGFRPSHTTQPSKSNVLQLL